LFGKASLLHSLKVKRAGIMGTMKTLHAKLRSWRLLLLVLVLLLPAQAGTAEGIAYTAVVRTDFWLRETPEDAARKLLFVVAKEEVEVLSLTDGWANISLKGYTGYAKAGWLIHYRSLNPLAHQVPGQLKQTGLARVTKAFPLEVAGYGGNQLQVGDVLAVFGTAEDLRVNMMRSEAALPEGSVAFTPFVPWRQAQPGDLLYAFTTFYNGQTGGTLAVNRAYNIALAISRTDGLTLAPGERFSFNQVNAPYLKSKGYQLAPIIGASGRGYGGGVCQLSTTLYNAVLALPFLIDKWEVHSEKGVDYIPRDLDASVGLYSDLAFTSLLDYPVRFSMLSQNGSLTVLVHRAQAQ